MPVSGGIFQGLFGKKVKVSQGIVKCSLSDRLWCPMWRLSISSFVVFFIQLVFSINSFALPKSEAFEFTFGVSCDRAKSGLCAIGTIPKGEKVTVLVPNSKKTCVGSAGEPFEEPSGEGGFSMTTIEGAEACEKPKETFVLLRKGTVKEYSGFPLQEIKEDDLRKKLHAQVEKVELRQEILRNSKNEARYEMKDFETALPTVYRYPGVKPEALFMRYRLKGLKGPTISVFKEKLQAFTDLCSPIPEGFQLNGQNFLKGGDLCCECGWNSLKIYRVEDTKVSEIYSDSSLSD